MKNICIYHKSCTDGFGAALAVKKYMDLNNLECEFVSAHYGDAAPNVEGMNVIIVDFSYPRDVLIKMNDDAEQIIVLDHHKTAQENLEGLPFCVFDMARSGAMLAWEYFFTNEPVPVLISHIQDRDLWEWKLQGTKEVSAALQLMPFDFELWLPLLEDKNVDKLKEKGAVVVEYQEQLINNATNSDKVRMVGLCGHTVPIVNTTILISEICGKLAETNPFAISYFDTPEKRVYSLRSRGGCGVDVSVIAKKFGGGGHKHAAGFAINYTETQL